MLSATRITTLCDGMAATQLVIVIIIIKIVIIIVSIIVIIIIIAIVVVPVFLPCCSSLSPRID